MKKNTIAVIILALSIIALQATCLAEKSSGKLNTAKRFHVCLKLLGYQADKTPDPKNIYQVITYKRNAYGRWGALCTIRASSIGGLLAGILVEADRDFPDVLVYFPVRIALQYIAAVSASNRWESYQKMETESARVWSDAYDRWEKGGVFYWRHHGSRVIAFKNHEVVSARLIQKIRDSYYLDEFLSKKADSKVLLKRLNGLLENILADLWGIPSLKQWDKEGPEKLIVEIRSRELCD